MKNTNIVDADMFTYLAMDTHATQSIVNANPGGFVGWQEERIGTARAMGNAAADAAYLYTMYQSAVAGAGIDWSAGKQVATPRSVENQTILSGEEWYKYFQDTYGAENVVWKANSFEHIMSNPEILYGATQAEIGSVLGSGWSSSAYGRSGTGWKFINDAHPDQMVFYHAADGVHTGSYYGFSVANMGRLQGTYKVVSPEYVPLAGDTATIIQMGR